MVAVLFVSSARMLIASKKGGMLKIGLAWIGEETDGDEEGEGGEGAGIVVQEYWLVANVSKSGLVEKVESLQETIIAAR